MPDYSIPTDKQIAEKLKQLITFDLSNPYSLRGLAVACGETPFTLGRIFKRIYGQSIAEFSLQLRMIRVKELLTTTNNALQMIAEAVGHTESTNFQNIFKRKAGMTPAEDRKRHKESAG